MQLNVEEQITLDRFQPRWYQSEIWDAIENKGYHKVLAILPRRSGKDITAWNMAIRQCLRKTCIVYYALPTYNQARKCIFDAIAIDGTKFLDYIPKSLIESINSAEMKIRFKYTHSILQLIGADSYDTSLVGTNFFGLVLSEFSLMNSEVYSYARPVIAANGGWICCLSCVSPETLVITESGYKRIKNISSSRTEYTDLNQNVYGIGGFHTAEQFYYGGTQPTLKITLEAGFQIECTSIHKLWNGSEWIKSSLLHVGDLLPIQYGQDVWGSGLDISGFNYKRSAPYGWSTDKLTLNEDLFYLLGLVHADGNYDRNKVCVTKKKDPEIISFLKDFGFKTRADGIHHEFSSREFCALLEFLGFKHGARNKSFPTSLLSATKKQVRAFLQGIFDGDGCSASNPTKRGYVKLTSACHDFVKDLQVVLLNFGIVASLRHEDKAPTPRVKVWSRIYNLEITGYFAHVFYREIGFRLERKQKNWDNLPASCVDESGNVYPVDASRLDGYFLPKNVVTNPSRMTRRMIARLTQDKPHPYLDELLLEKLFYSPIETIEASSSEVFDFVIPDTHSFMSNGFLSHNTPRGKNHLYHLWKTAQELPDWHVIKMGTTETQHIPYDVLMEEKASMDEGLYLQEFECSFERGIEGSFYGKHLDKLRLNGQITSIQWEPGLLVHVSLDIGVNDATTLIFFQVVSNGAVIRIIDCYSNNNLGIDHYAHYMQSKPYKYGRYFAPHDIKVREWGNQAITRYEMARQLGIDFTLVPQAEILDGIEAVWANFSKFWIDETKCRSLIDALENYRREWNEVRQQYDPKPVKSWSNHYADALRYMCLALPQLGPGLTSEEFQRQKNMALYGDQGLPRPFSHNPLWDGKRR